MSYLEFLARRTAFALVTVYAVVSLTFALITFTPNTDLGGRLASARRSGASGEEIEEIRQGYLEARGLDDPIYERYVDWLVDVTTFDWGYSFAYREPVVAVLDGRVVTTLEYVIPGVLLAVALGVVLGLFSALAKDSLADWVARVGSYTVLGVPAFMFIVYVTHVAGGNLVGGANTSAAPLMGAKTLGALAIAASLLAGQLRFARSSALEQTGREFVKLVRAKGASRLRTARHVLRNAALPIVSLSLTEVLAVLMLNVFVVEAVLGIRGIAGATLRAVRDRDMPLVIGATMVFVFVGIAGNLLQDVLYGYLDPRVND